MLRQTPSARPASAAAPRARCFHVRGPLDRDPQYIGLKLHQPVIGGGAAINPELRWRDIGRRHHGLEQLLGAERDGLEAGPDQVGPGGTAG